MSGTKNPRINPWLILPAHRADSCLRASEMFPCPPGPGLKPLRVLNNAIRRTASLKSGLNDGIHDMVKLNEIAVIELDRRGPEVKMNRCRNNHRQQP
jgi:hypothetical protein